MLTVMHFNRSPEVRHRQFIRLPHASVTGCIALCLLISCSNAPKRQPDLASHITGELNSLREIDLFLVELIRDLEKPNLEVIRRREAAKRLIQSRQPQIIDWLMTKLSQRDDPVTRQLIIQALATGDDPLPRSFTKPLLALLDQAEELPQNDLAAALGRFLNPKLIRSFVRIAQDRSANIAQRRIVIGALGYHHSQDVAGVLVRLTQSEQPTSIRDSACRALAQLSFSEVHDPTYWRDWWRQRKTSSDQVWYESVLHRATTRRVRLVEQSLHANDRLKDIQRQLYRMMPQADRPAYLITMLNDPLPPIRELAIDLCVQRLIDNQPIDTELRAALLDRLDDSAASIRRRAVTLLRDLGDEAAADAVARRLADRNESDPDVLRAYLLLMSRLPRREVVDQALGWIENRELTAAAASALAAAASQELLTTSQLASAAKLTRHLLRENERPQPELIELLGQVGGDNDWQRIAFWMNSDDDDVKQTAANVWADSRQPLRTLLEHAGDPVIQQVVISAARHRGFLPETLDTLLDHKPQQAQAQQLWQAAVIAVAGRVAPYVVLRADEALANRSESLDLRLRVLSSAVDRAMPRPIRKTESNGRSNSAKQEHASIWIELVLVRAEVQLEIGNPPQALADYDRLNIATASMAADQLNRFYLGSLRTKLAGGGLSRGYEWVEQIFASKPSYRQDKEIVAQIADLFVAAAQRSMSPNGTGSEKMVEIRQIVAQLLDLLEPAIAGPQRQKFDRLLRELEAAPTQPLPAREPVKRTISNQQNLLPSDQTVDTQ